MNTAVFDNFVKRIRESTAKILIVGGRSTNFDKEFRDQDRLIFWDGADRLTPSRIIKIPEGVGFILITRFISHSLLARIKKIKPDDVALLDCATGTGVIKEIVDPKVKYQLKDLPRPVLPARVRVPRGNVLRFLEENIKYIEAPVVEAGRLLAMCKEANIQTSLAYVKQLVWKLHRKLKDKGISVTGTTSVPSGTISFPAVPPPPSPVSSLGSKKILSDWKDMFGVMGLEVDQVLAEFNAIVARVFALEAEISRLKRKSND